MSKGNKIDTGWGQFMEAFNALIKSLTVFWNQWPKNELVLVLMLETCFFQSFYCKDYIDSTVCHSDWEENN
jgi:hypothetical protein